MDPTPYNYTTPNWKPLERAVQQAGLPLRICGQFMWMCEEPMGVHQYKHRDTRAYVRLTIDTPPPDCIRQLNAVLVWLVAELCSEMLRTDLYAEVPS